MEEVLYGYSVPEIADFVGKRNEKYLERFKRLHNRRKFNFAAAFFGGVWFGYRKMWLEGLAVMLYCALADLLVFTIYFTLYYKHIIFDLDKTSAIFTGVLYIIKFITIGFMADSIYWKNIKKRINFTHLPQEVRENKIGLITVFKECKGVSIWLGAVTMLVWSDAFDMLIAASGKFIVIFIIQNF